MCVDNMTTTLLTSCIPSVITLVGVIYTSKKNSDRTLYNVKNEIALVKKDISVLTEKVEKHNSVIDRTYVLETTSKILDERQKEIKEDVNALKEKLK